VCSPRVRLEKVATYTKCYCSSAISNYNFAASDIRTAANLFTYEVAVFTEGHVTGELPRKEKTSVFWDVTLIKATMKTADSFYVGNFISD
jgi:hypothetical protein